ncbi:hypothetical protein DL93DRAFT_2073775 [Clavulina sp. PMI_390]|nr:hypothetical protein DL93DRAFT_2073775 [Clavulina sp. PMI_390]
MDPVSFMFCIVIYPPYLTYWPLLHHCCSYYLFLLGHIFVSLSGSNVIKLKHVPRSVADDALIDPIVRIWGSGVQSSHRKGKDWQIILHGSPWTCKGEMEYQARRLVVILFQLLGDASYNYVSTVSPEGLSGSPTLIFAANPSFYPSHFFCLSFSGSRKKIYIIDAPQLLLDAIVATIRNNFKHSTEPKTVATNVFEMQLTTATIQRTDLPHQLANLLHAIGIMGYRLDANVSLGREGLFGLNGRREIWLFRSYSPMPGVMYT